ncbi:MAG TPA: HupE/UreJ family protein [Bacteroidota bacterium]|nr:HupE/UreJ family protein [Bacteroidota bacterium]
MIQPTHNSPKAGFQFLSVFALVLPSLVFIHVGVGQTTGFLHGFIHPLTGLDHICAMLAVGFWAAQRGGRALWVVPLTFVTVMVVGGLLGAAAISIPYVERGVVISVLMLGILVAASVRLPLVASSIIVGLFALLHGHVHGAEMPETVSGFAYGAGFVTATALLHVLGIAIATTVSKLGYSRVVRYAGVAIVLCGVYLWFV